MPDPECFVYILGSCGSDGYRTYVGWTTDLDRRVARHNAGTGARSTRGRVWILLYAEKHVTRREAMSREWHLKRDRKLRRSLLQCCQAAQANTQTGYEARDITAKTVTRL